MKNIVKNDAKKSKGATMVEYALLVALIAVVGIAALTLFGQRVSTRFSTVASQM